MWIVEKVSNKSTIFLLKWLGSLLSGVIYLAAIYWQLKKERVKAILLKWLCIRNALIQFSSTLNRCFCIFKLLSFNTAVHIIWKKILSKEIKKRNTFPLFGIYSMRLGLLPSASSRLTSYFAYFSIRFTTIVSLLFKMRKSYEKKEVNCGLYGIEKRKCRAKCMWIVDEIIIILFNQWSWSFQHSAK